MNSNRNEYRGGGRGRDWGRRSRDRSRSRSRDREEDDHRVDRYGEDHRWDRWERTRNRSRDRDHPYVTTISSYSYNRRDPNLGYHDRDHRYEEDPHQYGTALSSDYYNGGYGENRITGYDDRYGHRGDNHAVVARDAEIRRLRNENETLRNQKDRSDRANVARNADIWRLRSENETLRNGKATAERQLILYRERHEEGFIRQRPAPSDGPCWTSVMTPELISSAFAPFLSIERQGRDRNLLALCVVVGRDVAKMIRHEYLKDNNAFLLHCYSCARINNLAAKAKMLAWMEVNENWLIRCGKEINYSSISLNSSEDLTKLDLMDLQSGGIVYQGGASGAEGTPNSGDFVVGYEVIYSDSISTFFPVVESVEELPKSLSSHHHGVHLSISLWFASDTSFIFNDPRPACSFGILELLAMAMDGKSENDDVCKEVAATVLSKSPEIDCFKFLLTLPGVRRQASSLFHLLLYPFYCDSLTMLIPLLEEDIVNVNAVNFQGKTAVHTAVMRMTIYIGQHSTADSRKDMYKSFLLKLKVLLEFSANPQIADNDGNRPIDTLRAIVSSADKALSEYKEMVALLKGEHDTE